MQPQNYVIMPLCLKNLPQMNLKLLQKAVQKTAQANVDLIGKSNI